MCLTLKDDMKRAFGFVIVAEDSVIDWAFPIGHFVTWASTADASVGDDVRGIQALILCKELLSLECGLPDAVKNVSHKLHLGIFGSQATTKLAE